MPSTTIVSPLCDDVLDMIALYANVSFEKTHYKSKKNMGKVKIAVRYVCDICDENNTKKKYKMVKIHKPIYVVEPGYLGYWKKTSAVKRKINEITREKRKEIMKELALNNMEKVSKLSKRFPSIVNYKDTTWSWYDQPFRNRGYIGHNKFTNTNRRNSNILHTKVCSTKMVCKECEGNLLKDGKYGLTYD